MCIVLSKFPSQKITNEKKEKKEQKEKNLCEPSQITDELLDKFIDASNDMYKEMHDDWTNGSVY